MKIVIEKTMYYAKSGFWYRATLMDDDRVIKEVVLTIKEIFNFVEEQL